MCARTHKHTHKVAAVNCAHNFTSTDGCRYKLCDDHKLIQRHANSSGYVASVNMHRHTLNAAVVSGEDPVICLQAFVPVLASAI